MKKAFTLAEVLITLAIIGVVAAISIPSVVANTQQKEFQTGLRKAVSVLNSAITMNMAIDGETPYENKHLYKYLGRHMAIMKTDAKAQAVKGDHHSNLSFYTTDGMRFEFPHFEHVAIKQIPLYENDEVFLRSGIFHWGDGTSSGSAVPDGECTDNRQCAKCGSYGLRNNTDNTVNPPCLVVVDVNGDRKPFPVDPTCFSAEGNGDNPPCASVRKFGDPSGRHLTDTFSIMVTDKSAIPFGAAAQKAMYQAQKSK